MTIPRRNGCWNKPRPTTETSYFAQAGWIDRFSDFKDSPERESKYVEVKHAMTTACQYTNTTPDVACNGCSWQVSKP